MAKRQRVDTAKGLQELAADAEKKPIEPPAHIKLNAKERPYWDAVINGKARRAWTTQDLETAADLTFTRVDIAELKKELRKEGYTVPSATGNGVVVNPKQKLLDQLMRRAASLTRFLQLHAEATQGKSREQVQQNKAAQDAAEASGQAKGDDLIARPPATH